ncbi:MAG TPA: VOC family protein [Burkholderiaceae bacterium]|jgi:hypothetical protein
MHPIIHLAIPCRDLDETQNFYNSRLGFKLARRYDDRVTFDFFGAQLVCHLAPEKCDSSPQFYPRHFGATFSGRDEFLMFHKLILERKVPLYVEISDRFQEMVERHQYFAITDPSNNVLECKYYEDKRMIY